jgi:hypothetical protein
MTEHLDDEAWDERRRRAQRMADAQEEHRRRQEKLFVEARKLERSGEQVEVVEVDAQGRARLGRTYDPGAEPEARNGVAQWEGGYRRRGAVHEYDPLAGLAPLAREGD